jgi:hypothetical protein
VSNSSALTFAVRCRATIGYTSGLAPCPSTSGSKYKGWINGSPAQFYSNCEAASAGIRARSGRTLWTTSGTTRRGSTAAAGLRS